MMTTEAHEHDNSIYYKVFGALLVLTVITVALNKLEVGIALAVALALIVATMKASLVASFFMHLIAEKKMIYVVLGFTAFFLVSMIFLIVIAKYNTPEGTKYLEQPATTSVLEDGHDAGGEAHH